MKLALYIRVSTLDQNPEAQRRELEAYARRHGGEIVRVFEDRASGADPNRPALGELLDAARAGKFDCVLCWKLDRFGRSLIDLLRNIDTLAGECVRFISITEGIDTGQGYANPTAKLFLHMVAAVAEFEREIIRERSMSGQARYRQDWNAGKVGKTVHSQSGKDLPPHRPKKIIDVERIQELRRQGVPIAAICQRLGASRATIMRRLQMAARLPHKLPAPGDRVSQEQGK
jgi:DNA invertase Pin-like site-specific DNA recombinase